MRVGLRDFEIVAEDRIELYLERRDAGALPFALLDLRQKLFAVSAQVAKLVEFGIDAGLNDAAVAERNWRLRDDRAVDALAQIGEFID